MRSRAVLGDPMTRSELERHVSTAVDVFLRGIAPNAAPVKPKTKRK